ncbi:MAG: NAD(+) synthase [Bacteroidales bacterium]|nr:NAD(+) synthase [Bacteroidales bacterium]
MQNGFIKVAAGIPSVSVSDCAYNIRQIENMMARADGMGAEIICLPELCITAYTCQDLFRQQLLLDEAEASLLKLMEFSLGLNITALVGVPISFENKLFNCAAVIQKGKIYGLVPKTYLPNYMEFYEQRWFTSAQVLGEGREVHFCGQTVPLGSRQLFTTSHCTFGIEICEDLWAPIPPSSHLALSGADIIFNLSASNELIGKNDYLRSLIANQSARLIAGYVYAGSGYGESTQDLVFSGRAFICENGHMLAEAERFSMTEQIVCSEIDVERLRMERKVNTTYTAALSSQSQSAPCRIAELEAVSTHVPFTLTRRVDPHPFVPSGSDLDERCAEILSMQSQALARRIEHTHAKTAIVGISGGLDSTLALLVTVHAFDLLKRDRRGIVGITMPGFGTTDRTYTNAVNLMKELGVTIREISIADAVTLHFRDLAHDINNHDLTYENAQARERTQILMDAAGQMEGFVVGTGDLSELALGWATYNGDHMSMYGVNASIPKTLVRHLVRWAADNMADEASRTTLLDIADTPISPELIPADEEGNISQITEDLVGPYELHDFFLYHTLRFGFRPSKVFWLACRAFDGSTSGTVYVPEVIYKWLRVFYRRFFSQQFKRSCMPDGPKVGSCSLSPRGDWRMPSDASSEAWMRDLDAIGDAF